VGRAVGARAGRGTALLSRTRGTDGASGDGSGGQLAVVREDAGRDGTRVVDWGCGGDPAIGGAKAEDRPAGCQTHSHSRARRAVSAVVGAERRDPRCAAVAATPAEAGGDAYAGEEPVATSGAEPGRAAEAAAVEPERAGVAGEVAAGGMDGAAAERSAGDAGPAG